MQHHGGQGRFTPFLVGNTEDGRFTNGPTGADVLNKRLDRKLAALHQLFGLPTQN